MSDEQPKTTSAEIRAWLGVGIVLLTQTLGMVWWAATLSAEVRSLRELMVDQKALYAVMDSRVRGLEREVASLPRKSP